jgi:hypothetical protein
VGCAHPTPPISCLTKLIPKEPQFFAPVLTRNLSEEFGEGRNFKCHSLSNMKIHLNLNDSETLFIQPIQLELEKFLSATCNFSKISSPASQTISKFFSRNFSA